MNWRSLLFLYAAKVADDTGNHALANHLREVAPYVRVIDGGGFRILDAWAEGRNHSRMYQQIPEELPHLGLYEIAFVTPLETVTEERLYVRPIEPDWMRK